MCFTEKRPKNEEEERKEGAELAFWYNNVRKQTDTGKTPAEMGSRMIEYGETSEADMAAYESQEAMQEILQLMAEEKYLDAIKECDFELKRIPKNIDLLLLKAEALIRTGKTQKAQNVLEECRKIEPENPIIDYHLAEISILKKDFTATLSSVNRALQKDEKNFDFLIMKAQALSFMGDSAYFGFVKKAGETDPKRLENFLDNFWIENPLFASEKGKLLETAFQRLARRDNAAFLQAAEKVLLMPVGKDYREMCKGIEIEHCFDKKEIEQAKVLVDKLLESSPNNPHAHYYKANIEFHEGRATDALRTIDECIRVAEERGIPHFDYYTYKGKILNVLGKDAKVWERKAEELRKN